QVASPDQRVPATIERKAVEKAEAAVHEAETKIAAVKRWGRALEREILLYKGQCQQLARVVEGDLPQALLRLDRMVEALEQDVRLTAPSTEPKTLAAQPGEAQAPADAEHDPSEAGGAPP